MKKRTFFLGKSFFFRRKKWISKEKGMEKETLHPPLGKVEKTCCSLTPIVKQVEPG